MNEQLQVVARRKLKEGLAKCTIAQQYLFKRMYSPNDKELPIDDVVDNMSVDQLDIAMLQVQRTLDQKEKGSKTS